MGLVYPSPCLVDKYLRGQSSLTQRELRFGCSALEWSLTKGICFAVSGVGPSVLHHPVTAGTMASSPAATWHMLSELQERNNPNECTSDLNPPSCAFILPSAQQEQARCTRKRVVRWIQGFHSGESFWLDISCRPRGMRLHQYFLPCVEGKLSQEVAEPMARTSWAQLCSRAELEGSLLSQVTYLQLWAEVDHLWAKESCSCPWSGLAGLDFAL